LIFTPYSFFHSILSSTDNMASSSDNTTADQHPTTDQHRSADQYPLAQGLLDAVRLNTLHFLWKKEFPWVVHPSISETLEGVNDKDLRIADVGCGTG
jgi:chemotaxis methyl-accepting protein methylase